MGESETVHPSPPPVVTPLRTADGVSYTVALTNRPWELPVDALAVSVGAGFGQLAAAVQEVYPDADWASIDLGRVTPDVPALLELSGPGRGAQLRWAVLATPHAPDQRNSATAEAVATAAKAAIFAAAEAGARSIALPLFATGQLGMAAPMAAEALIEGALAAHTAVSQVIFFSLREDQVTTIAQQWETARIPRRATVAGFSPDQLAGGLAKDLVDPNECIPLTRDHLGVKPYVSMLATVIAAKDTPLPLSIGVFGEWGAGKSFFMGMLRGQVKELEGAPGQCRKIAQVGFNAWHYADANLWASLGDEIFRQLAEPVRQPGEPDAEHQARLREGARLRDRLAGELEQRKQLTAVTERAQAEAAALKRKIGEARTSRRTRALDLVRALGKSPAFREQCAEVWRKLGVGDVTEQGRLLAGELRETREEAGELNRISRYRQGRTALVVAGIVLLAGACLTAFVPDIRSWLIGVGAVAGALTTAGLTLVRAARGGLRRLRILAEDLQNGLDDGARREVAALRQADAEQQIAERQLEEVVARIGELGRQLTELTPGRRLYAFLAERSRTDDYQGNLGLISTIRKDFEKLVALMTTGDDDGTRPLDRIVLYIDDLDRCSPRQVVDVLQAVHLLLAFDLFVVVVGVDPRWLLRSLSSHYDRLIEADPVVRADGWHVTPEDYLEKILNIPLVLPRMPEGSLRRLLDGMAEPPAATPATPAEDVREPEPAPPSTATWDRPATDLPVEPGSQVAAQLDPAEPPAKPRPLTEPEIALLARLDRLVDTPRDAKRLINLYRMLRATRDLSEASAFLDGEFEAAVVLLGTCTAHGRLLGRFADALLRRAPQTPWTDFVADLQPEESGDRWRSQAIGPIPAGEVAHWAHLHRSLTELAPSITLPDVSVFQTWVPRVRRFSYVLSPGAL
ncbi:P-loop NTPase fold protein [Amycolatopsis sp. DG1A-15b]|uniref:P-loop NTPase fold protein n=1 Tax=Amycolatopsis sp. DG1A-15b TaxID=3052846 RepID=UPI00255BB3C8|nr:P-loop NTPase fold protein [Amycolatopsis sp. DG1A-15b]WIX91274.1 P-loop NTPase fold protein [Amycolatopsis sp. DG1A-15b]